jgi:uncharacterized OsmC-like protein
MKVEVDWAGGIAFEAIAESGHKVMMDASPAAGGWEAAHPLTSY